MILRFLFLLILFSFSQFLLGQISVDRPVPVSPSSASLGKYAEYPIGYYTGIPKIDIPIYNIEYNDYTIPISLSYHAGGNKVDEISSPVGLGWVLQAGGVITRSVRGKDDLKSNPYYDIVNQFKNTIPATVSFQTTPALSNERADFLNFYKSYDMEPDIFYFNFGNYSGKFMLFSDGSYYTLPLQNIRIAYSDHPSGRRFELTTTDGVRYVFGISSDGSRSAIELSSTNFSDGTSLGDIQSTWYLMEVVSPNNNSTVFNYEPTQYSFNGSWSQSRKVQFDPSNIGAFDPPEYVQSRINGHQLKSIVFANGKVEFANALSRCDLSGAKGLTEITVSQKMTSTSYEAVKKVKLNYSYFTPQGTKKIEQTTCSDITEKEYRLKLDSIGEISPRESLRPYIFEYNSVNLPGRSSTSIDHWGYFNNKTNGNVYLPKMFIVNGNSISWQYVWDGSGADRSVDPAFAKAGVLERIYYPAGGRTEFEYESNTFKSDVYSAHFSQQIEQSISSQNIVQRTASSVLMNNQAMGNEIEFNIDYSYTQTVNLKLSCNPMASDCYSECFRVVVSGAGPTNNAYRQVFDLAPNNQSGFFASFGIEPGKYKIRIERKSGYVSNDGTKNCESFALGGVISVGLTYKTLDSTIEPVRNVYAGGLRIKSKTDYALNAVAQMQRFDYSSFSDPTLSSGSYVSYPIYTNSVSADDNNIFFIYSSNSSTPLSTTSGSYIGYKNVTVFNDANSDQGKTELTYTTVETYPDTLYDRTAANGSSWVGINPSLISFLKTSYPPTCNVDWRRGLLLLQKEYKKSENIFKLVQQTTNDYVISGNPQIDSRRKNTLALKSYAWKNGAIGKEYLVNFYSATTEFIYLSSQEQSMYDDTGAETKTSKKYYYDNNLSLLPDRIEESGSKGDQTTIKRFYPINKSSIANSIALSSTASDALDRMIAKNILGTVVLEEKYRSGLLLGKQYTDFKYWGSNQDLIARETVYDQVSGNPLIERERFKNYDKFGNVLETQKMQGAIVCYLWGYNSQYPIAEIINADYSEVLSKIGGQTVLDQLNSISVSDDFIMQKMMSLRDALPNAQINSFTYKPLFGMTSKTDPRGITEYYKYDGARRLQAILDHLNNVNRSFNYHYRKN